MQIEELLNANGQQLIRDIQFNMSAVGQTATGDTANSLQITITKEGTSIKMALTGRPYFFTVQTGRKPTPGVKPSQDMIDNIKEWADARGISNVWGIAVSIQEHGTKLWQQGGRRDIVNPAVDDFINNTAEAILANEAERFKIRIQESEWNKRK